MKRITRLKSTVSFASFAAVGGYEERRGPLGEKFDFCDMTDTFGKDTFEIMEHNPEFLAQVNGISMKKALEIGRNFKAQFGMRSVMMFASQFFGPSIAVRIYKRWGSAAIDQIRDRYGDSSIKRASFIKNQ